MKLQVNILIKFSRSGCKMQAEIETLYSAARGISQYILAISSNLQVLNRLI